MAYSYGTGPTEENLGEFGPDHLSCAGGPEQHRGRTAERLPIGHRQLEAGHQAVAREKPEPGRVLSVDLAELQVGADRCGGQGNELGVFNVSIGGGNRVAVGIVLRIAERRGHSLDYQIGRRVFEPLGFNMYRVPIKTEMTGQIEFENPVAPNRLEGGVAAFVAHQLIDRCG